MAAAVPEVIAEYAQWCRGNTKLVGYKRSAELRGAEGAASASRYGDVTKCLVKWYEANHIEEIFSESGGFRFVESMTEGDAKDLYDEFDAGNFDDFEDREAANEAIIELESSWVDRSLPNFLGSEWVHSEPSNPEGIPYIDPNFGLYRTHCPVCREGEAPSVMPAPLMDCVGGRVGRFTMLDNSTLGWPGLSADPQLYLVEATLAGFVKVEQSVLDAHNADSENPALPDLTQFQVSGLELVAPNRTFRLDYPGWSGIPVVESVAEAVALRRSSPEVSIVRMLGSVDFDDRSTWIGNVYDSEGHSIFGAAETVITKPSAILEVLGLSNVAGMEDAKKAAEGFFELSLQAAHGAATRGKGKLHVLPRVPAELTARHTDPLTGDKIAASTTAEIRLELATRVGKPGECSTRLKCEEEYFCPACNAQAWVEVLKDVSLAELADGNFRMTQAMKEVTVTLGRNKVVCSCGRVGCPPLGSVVPCVQEDCDSMLVTPKHYQLNCCQDCGLPYGKAMAGDKGVKIRNAKKATILQHQKELDAGIYAYLRHHGGDSVLEEGDAELADLAQLQIRLNELRAAPDDLKEGSLPLLLSERLILWIGTADFGPHSLQIEDGFAAEVSPQEPIPKLDKLKSLVEKEQPKPPVVNLGGYSDFEKVEKYIAAYRRLLKLLAQVAGRAYDNDPAVAAEIVEEEFLAAVRRHRYPAKQVRKILQAALENIANRLRKKIKLPNVSHLFGFEDKHGGCIRLLPHLGCEEVVRAAFLQVEDASYTMALESLSGQSEESSASEPLKGARRRAAEPKKVQAAKGASGKEGTKFSRAQARQQLHDEQVQAAVEAALKAEKGRAAAEKRKKQADKERAKGKKGGSSPKAGKGKGGRQAPKEFVYPPPLPTTAPQQQAAGKKAKDWVRPEFYSSDDVSEDSEDAAEAWDSEGSENSGRRPTPQSERAELIREESKVAIQSGEHPGNSLLPNFHKLKHTLLYDQSQGCCICQKFQTEAGCPEQEGFKCPFAHVDVEDKHATPEWALFYLLHGGHKMWEGSLSEESLMSLLSEPQRFQAAKLGAEARRVFLLHHMYDRISHLTAPNGEPMSAASVQEGARLVYREELWGPGAPMPLASPSGIPAESFSRMVIGTKDAITHLTVVDVGQIIQVRGATGKVIELDFMCQIKARAAVLSNLAKNSPQEAGREPDLVLLQQVVDSLLLIPAELLSKNPKSRLAELYVQCAEVLDKGFPDGMWGVCGATLLSNKHCLTIGVPSDTTGVPTYRLSVAHSNIPGELLVHADNADKIARRRFTPAAYAAPVTATTSTRPDGKNRHAEGALLGKDTGLEFWMQKLCKIAKAGKGRVILSGRPKAGEAQSCWESYTQMQGLSGRVLREGDLQKATEKLTWIQRQVGKPQKGLQLHLPLQLREDEEAVLARLTNEAAEKLISEHAGAAKPALTAEERAKRRAKRFREWQQEHVGVKLQSNKDWAAAYDAHIQPMLDAPLPEGEAARAQQAERALSIAGQFLAGWFLQRIKLHRSPKDAKEDIVSTLRKRWFGARSNEGPAEEQVRGEFIGALSRSHMDLISEFISRGADPVFLGDEKGYMGKPYPSVNEVQNKMLMDHLAEARERRALIFDLDVPGLTPLLLQAGIKVSPTVTALKTTAAGEPRLDEFGETLLRMCTDCCDGGKPEAANSGIHSGDHTLQKTTSPAQAVHKVMQEEKKFPGHQLSFSKLDVNAAFKQLATILRRVGLFCTEVLHLVAVHLTLIFGSGASPGCFEVLGAAIIPKVLSMPREEAETTGLLHPEMVRFVDDVFSAICQYGDRAADHMHRLASVIRALLGVKGLNMDKQEEEGTPSNWKHAFGVVLDALERLVMAPWSKVVKFFNVTSSYVNGEQDKLSYEQVASARGLSASVLFCAPGLARIVQPRFDAMLADASARHPGVKKIPKDCYPSPALAGESEEQGHKMLRRALNLVLRLGTIQKGKLLRIPFEMSQPRVVRETWPGREGPENVAKWLMDASGKALFLIDLNTGRYIQEQFTPEEQEIFNRFELGHLATDINQREALSELWGIMALGPAHPGKLLDMINDNTSAESWTEFSRHSHARIDHILAIIGLCEVLLKQTAVGSRVNTGDNFADTGTRADLQADFERGLQKLSERHGWVPQKVELKSFMRDVGWVRPAPDQPERTWYDMAVSFLQHLEATMPGLIERQCGVAFSEILQALQAAQKGTPLCGKLIADGDYGDTGHSSLRELLTSKIPVTRMQLRRKWARLEESHGSSKALEKFRKFLKAQLPVTALTTDSDRLGAHNLAPGVDGFPSRGSALALQSGVPDRMSLQQQSQHDGGSTGMSGQLQQPSQQSAHNLAPKVSDSTDPEVLINEALQVSFEERVRLISQNNESFDPSFKREPEGQVLRGWAPPPGHRLASRVTLSTLFSGSGAVEKAATASQWAELVSTAEKNPIFRDHLRQCDPEAVHYGSVEEYEEQSGEGEAEIIAGSPPCIAHSVANLHRKGEDDKEAGLYYAHMAELVNKKKPAAAWFECTELVKRGRAGKDAPLKKFKKTLKGYHSTVVEIRADKTTSPFSDLKACVTHNRVYVFVWAKACFNKRPVITPNRSVPHKTAKHVLDFPSEAQQYRVMPLQDQKLVNFKFRRADRGMVYVATVADPEKGRGHRDFPNEVCDPRLGRMPVATGESGTIWFQDLLNGRPVLRRGRTIETSRAYCCRDIPESWMAHDSEIGQSDAGNKVPQNVADWVLAQVLNELSRVQSDGLTGHEKWEAFLGQQDQAGGDSTARAAAAPMLNNAALTTEGSAAMSVSAATTDHDGGQEVKPQLSTASPVSDRESNGGRSRWPNASGTRRDFSDITPLSVSDSRESTTGQEGWKSSPCGECRRARDLTREDVYCHERLGMGAKPEHSHCHRCDAVCRANPGQRCPACVKLPVASKGVKLVRFSEEVQVKEIESCLQGKGQLRSRVSWPTRRLRRHKVPVVLLSDEELAGGKRKVYRKTPSQDEQIARRTKFVQYEGGKKEATFSEYEAMLEQWKEVCREEGWPWQLKGVALEEKQRRLMHFLSAEYVLHGNKCSTARKKLSAIRWAHVVKLLGNPLKDCDGVEDYLENWRKLDGAEEPKLPVPVPLLRGIVVLLGCCDNLDADALIAALCHGFWFLLRAIEYLADDGGYYDPDRSISWADLAWRNKSGKILTWDEAWENPDQIHEETATLYSSKNNLETCTRSLKEVAGSDICVVASTKRLMKRLKKQPGFVKPKKSSSPFEKANGKVYTRAEVSEVLKAAAHDSGLPRARFASHSLRRGAASAYAAAGLSRIEIQRAGRWTSDCFERYIFEGSNTLNKVLETVTYLVPRFERS